MEKRFANFVSRVFNPLIITTIFLLIVFNLPFHFATMIPEKAKWMILGLIIITTFIIPGLLVNIFGIMLSKKMDLKGRESRFLPLAVTSVFYLLTYHLLNQISLSPIFSLFILGISSLSVFSLIVMFFRNISLYMVATGALTGAFLGLYFTLNVNLAFYLLLSFVIAGLTGYSRLLLEKHNPVDIYIGYFAGVAIMLLHYIYL